MTKTIDARILRSRFVMRQAAMALLAESDRFSISELLASAHVTRGNFYRHYSNKADLIHDVNGDLVAQLLKHNLVAQLLKHNNERFVCYGVIQQIADQAEFYHEVFNHKKTPRFFLS